MTDVDVPEVRAHLEYWRKLRGDRIAPPWSAFDWSEINPKCIPNFTVVDVSLDPLDFIYRFWGTNLARGQKQEMTGRSVHELKPHEEGQSIYNQYREVYEAKEPILFMSSVSGWMLEDLTVFSLRMPFSDDGENVSHITSCADFQDAYTLLKHSVDDP